VKGSEIVVGIDGGHPAQAALRWAAKLARTTESRLRAVCVLQWPVGFTAGSSPGSGPIVHLPNSEVNGSYVHGMVRVFNEVDPSPDWLFWERSHTACPEATALRQPTWLGRSSLPICCIP